MPWSMNIKDGFPALISKEYSDLFVINTSKNATTMRMDESFLTEYKNIIQPDLVILQTDSLDIVDYFYSTSWNKSKPTKEELKLEERILDEIKNNLYIIVLFNMIFFLFFFYKVKSNYHYKYNSND